MKGLFGILGLAGVHPVATLRLLGVVLRDTYSEGNMALSRSIFSVLCSSSLTFFAANFAAAQLGPPKPPETATNAEKPLNPIPPEKSKITSHTMALSGRELHYTAT